RSHTPTISHPWMRWICDACESAILPQPTMATLSMLELLPAALEVPAQSFWRGYVLRPPKLRLHLVIAVAGASPVRAPAPPIEDGRQLPFRPSRIGLPRAARGVTQDMWQVDRFESSDMAFVETQELPARGQIVVDDVEDFPVDA